MKPFATIKKLPRQRTLTEEVGIYSRCESNAHKAASFTRKYRSLELTFKTSFTSHHPLSLKPDVSLVRLASGFGFKAMPPRQEVFSVYTEAR